MRIVSVIVPIALASGIGCSDETSSQNLESEGAAGQAGAPGSEAGGQCAIDPAGEEFAFRLVNGSDADIRLDTGCFGGTPMQLEGSEGPLLITPDDATFCGTNCDSIYAGDSHAEGACSDCGPSFLTALKPGDSWTFRWDRRIYVPHTVPAECSGHEDDNFCALGSKVDPEVDRGVVEFTPLDEEGDALDAVEVSFSLDQGESEVEIVLE
jgi:hypothetical protein